MDAATRQRALLLAGIPAVRMYVPPRAEERAEERAVEEPEEFDDDLEPDEADDLDEDEGEDEPEDEEDDLDLVWLDDGEDPDDEAAVRHRELALLGVELRARPRSNPLPGDQVISQAGADRYGLPIGATIPPGLRLLTKPQREAMLAMPAEEQARFRAARARGMTPAAAAKVARGDTPPVKKATPAKAARTVRIVDQEWDLDELERDSGLAGKSAAELKDIAYDANITLPQAAKGAPARRLFLIQSAMQHANRTQDRDPYKGIFRLRRVVDARPTPSPAKAAKKAAAPAKKATPSGEFDPDEYARRIVDIPQLAGETARDRTRQQIEAELTGLDARQLRRVATALNLPIPVKRREGGTWTRENLRAYIAENVARDRTRWSLGGDTLTQEEADLRERRRAGIAAGLTPKHADAYARSGLTVDEYKAAGLSVTEAIDFKNSGQSWDEWQASRGVSTSPRPATDTAMSRQQAGLDRQARIDRARATAEALSEADELVANKASAEALFSRVQSRVKRGGLTQEQAVRLTAAAQSGDRDRLNTEIEALATAAGLERVTARAGEVVPYDPKTHRNIGTGDLRGKMVHVVRPGYALPGVEREPWSTETGPLVVHRATVEEATPDEAVEAIARQARERQGAQPLTTTDISVQKAREELDGQVADVQRLVDGSASDRAVVSTMRTRLRRLRLQPLDADGNQLTGTDPAPATRYVWQRPGGDVDLDGPAPADWPEGEREEFTLAQQLARRALAVEAAVRRDGVTPALVDVARGEATTTPDVPAPPQTALPAPRVETDRWTRAALADLPREPRSFEFWLRQGRELPVAGTRPTGQPPASAERAAEVEDAIREAALAITRRGGSSLPSPIQGSSTSLMLPLHDAVSMLDLRDQLGDRFLRSEVDDALQRMQRGTGASGQREIILNAWSTEAELSVAEVAASIHIGGDRRHLVSFTPEFRRTAVTNVEAAPIAPAADVGLNAMKVRELRELARERGIRIPSGARKADIIRLLGGTSDATRSLAEDDEETGMTPDQRSRLLALLGIEQRADTPGNDLKRYWTKDPEGLAKWASKPHPWTALYRQLRKHVGAERAKRIASQWFKEVFGIWPGERKGSNKFGPG